MFNEIESRYNGVLIFVQAVLVVSKVHNISNIMNSGDMQVANP